MKYRGRELNISILSLPHFYIKNGISGLKCQLNLEFSCSHCPGRALFLKTLGNLTVTQISGQFSESYELKEYYDSSDLFINKTLSIKSPEPLPHPSLSSTQENSAWKRHRQEKGTENANLGGFISPRAGICWVPPMFWELCWQSNQIHRQILNTELSKTSRPFFYEPGPVNFRITNYWGSAWLDSGQRAKGIFSSP